MKRTYFSIGFLVAVGALVASLALYPYLPGRIPTHWNIHGQVDGYGAKWWAVFLMPGIIAALLGFFALLPWLSPRHFEVETFRATYLYIMLVTVALFGYFHALMLWAALASPVDVGRSLLGGVFLFFALLGNVLGKVRRNFYIGVRTPWTLANERVWDATHRFAARLFVLAGLLGLVVTIAGVRAVFSFIILLTAALASVGYSLVYYKRLERRGEV